MANVWLIYGYSVCFLRISESHGRTPLSLEGLFHGTNLKWIITGGTPMTKGKPPYDIWQKLAGTSPTKIRVRGGFTSKYGHLFDEGLKS